MRDGVLAVKRMRQCHLQVCGWTQRRSRQQQIIQMPYGITYMWNLKYDMSELVYKGEIDSHREQTGGCQGQGRRGKGRAGSWGSADANYSYRAGEQQGPTVEHRAPYSISCNKHNGKEYGNKGSAENKQTKNNPQNPSH